jgi:type II secretory ATPase GspE/PulE/Tfp pilus assembly ATPase PilB-like protein
MDDARSQDELVTARRASVLGLDYVDTSKIQKQLFKNVLTVAELRSLKVIPLVADEHNIHFGITTTTSQQTINGLRARFTDQRVIFSIISETGFREYMSLYDPPKKVEYEDISFSGDSDKEKMIEGVSQTLDKVRPDDMLAYLVQQAYELKASDIHLECQKDDVRVRFRVDGVLHPVAYVAKEKYRHLSASLASAANVSTQETEPQTGHISRSFKMATGEDVTVNLRVETVPTVHGMDAVMRLFNMSLELLKLENLGLSGQESAVVNEVIQHPTGMVLIVGPTGSGKTTTLYSLINTLNTPERKIITLEDPVEKLKDQLKAVINTMPPHIQKPDLNNLTLYKPGSSQTNPFGYTGQLAIREQLQMTHGVQQLLRQPPNQITTEMLQAQAVQDGMRTMLHDGLLKAVGGLTTLEEVYRVVG